MTVVETRVSVWEALAGRAPGQPAGPADAGLWSAVAQRLNPAKARPVLRTSVETAELTSVRGVEYVMLRSPDRRNPCYLRLTPQEWQLAQLMDGTRTVARLVAEFAKISGRLAPDQVTRVVADLAGNRMLDELPVNAFHRIEKRQRRPWPVRYLRGLLAFARGRRLVLARIDPVITVLYKAGGRLFFTRPVAVLCALVALAGLGVFGWSWWRGEQQVFLSHGSYVRGALVLLGLNALALACHELGHALATKHAKRRVPAAGFLVYFGIPSVFVDTTDVWMAGRKARLVTTAAGPATGLVLAGACQLVGLLDPALAPWCFKLSFAWYVNVAFNLNPFLALDGYYLLMDWLEIPNLRARALSWVLARLRRRPPAFGTLDREGRLIALYGMLSLIWLAIGVNIAYRVYVDRVAGLVTGVWAAGWWQRVLVVLVVLGLVAPAVYGFAGWLRKRARRTRERFAERQIVKDQPRRVVALRDSALGQLSGPQLDKLAEQARWVHPRTGSQLVFAGAAQPSVFVVVDGALEARRPGDPAGTVRERVGPGGVVGLGNALTGAASALSWYTAGTTLLSLPNPAVAGAVGPLTGPPPGERAELDELLVRAPALAGLSTEDRLGLTSQARSVTLPPGQPLVLPAGCAAVLAAGTVQVPGGAPVGAGGLVGPADDEPQQPPVARTPVRAWILPAAGGLPLLLGAGGGGTSEPGTPPGFGVHPPGGYPPLAGPPGPPPDIAEEKDKKFERKLWWLLILLLLLALLFTGGNFFYTGPAWGEMPADKALLTVSRGTVAATVGRSHKVLRPGDQVYLGEGDQVTVAARSTGQLTFRGGALTVLCGGSSLDVGPLVSGRRRPVTPTAALTLSGGRVLADTRSTSGAYRPLALSVATGGSGIRNDGVARYAVEGGGADVAVGTVLLDNSALPVSLHDLSCGDGTTIPRPMPSDSPSPTPSPSPSPTDSPSPSPSPSASTGTTPTPGKTTGTPTKTPSKSPSASTSTSPPPPRDTTPPVVRTSITREVAQIYFNGAPCNSNSPIAISMLVAASDDSGKPVTAWYTYTMPSNNPVGPILMGTGTSFSGSFSAPMYGTVPDGGGTIVVDFTVTDAAGNTTVVSQKVVLDACFIIG